jgi:hypothetical protein
MTGPEATTGLAGWITARAAADLLGVSVTQVHRLADSDQLEAERPGRELFVSAASVQHRAEVVRPRAGRPLSPRMAWAVLTHASGRSPSWISLSEMTRVRKHAMAPLLDWPSGLARRADVHHVRMLPYLQGRLRHAQEGVARGGAAAAAEYGSSFIGADIAEFYISAAVLAELQDTKGIKWNSPQPEANVILRVVPASLPAAAIDEALGGPRALRAATAIDLLEHGDDRSVTAAAELLRGVATVAR